ncbi:MAG: class I SAM-dependent methyltransferase [Acidobacteria bacterium]|nr:class I SAM-dependent methyltransferase [Acidobacteriota bacterium]
MTSSASPRFEPGSFRDPDTRVFHHEGTVFRALTEPALADWRRLADTRFYRRMSGEGRLVGTREVTGREDLPALAPAWAAVLEHARIPVVSYPYEWSFGMLRDAALLQLDLTLAALDEEMTLKDATPFNVQWHGVRPTFIDLGSFTVYQPGDPWTGYRQFCETFLYPLFLQAYRNAPFHPWLRGRLDGMTAAECRSLLSARDWLRPGVLAHVCLQAQVQARYEASNGNVRAQLRAAGFGAALIRNNVARLRRTVERLRWTPARSTWSEYADEHGYEDADLERKAAFVRRVLESRRWSLVWDVGCNTGAYSRLAADHADYVVALDADHVVVDRLYRALRDEGRTNVLPLVADAADPSPGLGWRGRERRPLGDRCSPELILCLALAHHLVIGRHVPFADLADWLADFEADVILEFVDRGDPMVERLLRHRDGGRLDYSRAAAEAALARHFHLVGRETLASGARTLYHCRRRADAGP